MDISDFNYNLPDWLIAQKPAVPRDGSRLMVVSSFVEHKKFYDIVDYLKKGDVLVVNETKVIPAKILGHKETGSPVELIVEKDMGFKCLCRIKTKNPIVGTKLVFGKYKGEIVKQDFDVFIVKFNFPVSDIMDDIGIMPTPPYIKRKLDREGQYQTIYSKQKGSVAAPTAGLHFTNRLLDRIKKKGVKIAKVCLHVGYGTFLEVSDVNVKKLHKEYYSIDSKNAKIINDAKRLIVVGTTSVRVLESVADSKGKVHACKGETKIFIKPGYKFKTKIDMMITNFHLPKSTLLMLVSAFIGRERILNAYSIAVKKKYRFFSLGDAMLLLK